MKLGWRVEHAKEGLGGDTVACQRTGQAISRRASTDLFSPIVLKPAPSRWTPSAVRISWLDYLIFTYTLCSTELVRKKASVIACCVVESSAGVKDIDSNYPPVCTYCGLSSPGHGDKRARERLSSTEAEKASPENWYKSTNY